MVTIDTIEGGKTEIKTKTKDTKHKRKKEKKNKAMVDSILGCQTSFNLSKLKNHDHLVYVFSSY